MKTKTGGGISGVMGIGREPDHIVKASPRKTTGNDDMNIRVSL